MIKHICSIFCGAFALCFKVFSQECEIGDSVLFEDKLVQLDEKGTFHVWNIETWKRDKSFEDRLTCRNLSHIASNGKKLWAVDRLTLYIWSDSLEKWVPECGLRSDREYPKALVIAGDIPFLVFSRKIVNLSSGRNFRVPDLKGQLKIDYLEILSLYSTKDSIWIGTGQGEWGGHLIGFSAKDGGWVQYYDELHYATGISQSAGGELIVSWAMSHFGANALIRFHGMDGKPSKAYRELKGCYYQALAFNRFDGKLYGIERGNLAIIEDGASVPIAGLKGHLYRNEPRAIGVSPGIKKLIPVRRDSFIVIPAEGAPLRIEGGVALSFEAH